MDQIEVYVHSIDPMCFILIRFRCDDCSKRQSKRVLQVAQYSINSNTIQSMSICSYIVYPAQGKIHELKKKLTALKGCDVIPSKNMDILVLVTESNSETDEKKLQIALKSIKEIQCMALTFGNIE